MAAARSFALPLSINAPVGTGCPAASTRSLPYSHTGNLTAPANV